MRVGARILAGVALAAVAASALHAQAPAEAPVVAIRAGTLIDGTGAAPVRNAVIVIRGERIEAVGPSVRVPAGARVIDLSRYTVLPGFIDAHVHLASRPLGVGDFVHRGVTDDEGDDALWGVADARATLLAGFTTVRDVGSAYVREHRTYAGHRGGACARAEDGRGGTPDRHQRRTLRPGRPGAVRGKPSAARLRGSPPGPTRCGRRCACR